MRPGRSGSAARPKVSSEGKRKMGEHLDDAKGRVKEAAGDLTNDEKLEREGKVDQATAAVKEKVGEAADKVKGLIGKD
jgi:uncharacterized protein YjbJ (UPF0337 family)